MDNGTVGDNVLRSFAIAIPSIAGPHPYAGSEHRGIPHGPRFDHLKPLICQAAFYGVERRFDNSHCNCLLFPRTADFSGVQLLFLVFQYVFPGSPATRTLCD